MTGIASLDILLHLTNKIVSSFELLLFLFILSFILKIFILIRLILHNRHSTRTSIQLTFLLIAIGGSIILSSAWILKILYKLYFTSMDYRLLRFWIRLTWAFNTIHYHALAIFIESLVKKRGIIKNWRQKILMPISGLLFLFFTVLAFARFNHPSIQPPIELFLIKFSQYYFLFPILATSLFISVRNLKSFSIPKILRKQFNILIKFIFLPMMITEIIHFQPIRSLYQSKRYTVACISMLLITYALYHCIKKIMGLRFLNLKEHVQTPKKFNFANDFKNILEKFSQITNKTEISHVTKFFFKDAFSIPIQKTHLYIRKLQNKSQQNEEIILLTPDEITIEEFLSSHTKSKQIKYFLTEEKILITDELVFTNFYEEKVSTKQIITFLEQINADIFLPVYENKRLIAYIIIEKHSRIGHVPKNSEFFSNVERDQMIVFANYLGNIINLMKNKNLNKMIKKEKDLNDTLFSKLQEVKKYKESIKSFIRTEKEKDLGIIIYKNSHFTMGNQIAQSLIEVNLNTHTGHPITQKIKDMANKVVKYKSSEKCFIKNNAGEKLVVSAIHNAGSNNIIITIKHPEISDILEEKISMLKDPTKWEYLLYLETTEAGKIIKKFIPGNGETLLNFKTELLRAALNKNAILIDLPENDLVPTVEILHHISQRETLHSIELKKEVKDFNIAIQLFGANPIFGFSDRGRPLLEKLDKTGTLFIKNVNLLNPETQQYLADYLKYGLYKNFKGDQMKSSDVKIICSTDINLKPTIQDKKINNNLFMQLNKTFIQMPSLLYFAENEIIHLTSEVAKQAIKTNEFHSLLELTESEKRKIINTRPDSIQELKEKVKQILIKKSKKHAIYNEAQFDPSYSVIDPELIAAARLGKHVLKDPKIMAQLWNKFKNQNKIANLLGVNRSSVNRRCKEYDLL